MKNIARNITASFLAFLVLLSTMSFTISSHYCGDTLVSTTLVFEAEGCGMEMNAPSPNEGCSVMKKDCCKDEVQLVEGQNDLKLDFSDLDLHQQLFVASFIYTYVDLFEGLETNFTSFNDYSPPLVVKDIQLLDGVFLI